MWNAELFVLFIKLFVNTLCFMSMARILSRIGLIFSTVNSIEAKVCVCVDFIYFMNILKLILGI